MADSIDDDFIPRVSVNALARRAGVTTRYYYDEASRGRAPKSCGGVTIEEARAWLAERAAKKAARKATRVAKLRRCLRALETAEDDLGKAAAGRAPGEGDHK